jgi:hypothetical protein
MIDFLPESTENILGVRFTGKLKPHDYREALAPRIESLLERFQTLRVLVLIDEKFDGWTLPAAWANTTFDLKHRRDFDKIAMVGAPKWEEWCVRAPATLLMRGKLGTFRRDQLDRAWDWLRA